MGFLELGTPLTWGEALSTGAAEYVRKHGIEQFIETYNRVKSRHNDVLKWGDEIEYHLVELPPPSTDGSSAPDLRGPRLALIAPEVIEQLEDEDTRISFPIPSAWRPEYGSWMVEATPGVPYGGYTTDLLCVERNMAMRRWRIARATPRGVVPFSIVAFPLLGVGDAFTEPRRNAGGPFSESRYIPDAVISPHPRFGALTANIRQRRGAHVDIRVPLFIDAHTRSALSAAAAAAGGNGSSASVREIFDARLVSSAVSAAATWPSASPRVASGTRASERADEAVAAAKGAAVVQGAAAAAGAPAVAEDVSPYIHMDAMAFGMGCCCLQVTFQARDLRESRILYDQLAVVSPLMLALTANSPVWRGYLADTDTRWGVISASVDCRTPTERSYGDEAPPPPRIPWQDTPNASAAAARGERRILKSRYSSVDAYISDSPRLSDVYHNDLPAEYDESAKLRLVEAGVDERLARHIAHLFIRDPLVIMSGRINEVDDARSSEHFENIQSTNWRSVRWKPPPPDAVDMGWRVELRTMEAQVTDFENAAFTVFVVLLSRVVLFFDLNLYMPLSLVDVNFERAAMRGALGGGGAPHSQTQRFWFPSRIICSTATAEGSSGIPPSTTGVAATGPCCGAASGEGVAGVGGGSSGGGVGGGMVQLTMSQILLGDARVDFPGLMPLIFAYLDLNGCDTPTRDLVEVYMRFVRDRATGAALTGASWQRAFIVSHPDYARDSLVSPRIVTDLLTRLDDIAQGRCAAPELLGPHAPPPFVLSGSIEEVLTQLRGGGAGGAGGGSGAAAPCCCFAEGVPEDAASPAVLSAAKRAAGGGGGGAATADAAAAASGSSGSSVVQEGLGPRGGGLLLRGSSNALAAIGGAEATGMAAGSSPESFREEVRSATLNCAELMALVARYTRALEALRARTGSESMLPSSAPSPILSSASSTI